MDTNGPGPDFAAAKPGPELIGRSLRTHVAVVAAVALACVSPAMAAAIDAAAAPLPQGGPQAPGAQAPAQAQADLAFVRAARLAMAHGQRSEAEAMARARGASDPAAAAVLARLAADSGRYDEAVATVRKAAAANPTGDAALELGLLLLRLGKKVDARAVLSPVAGSARTANSPETLLRAAAAAQALGQTRTANTYFRGAAEPAADDPAINTAWGELFLDTHNRAEAAASFRTALKRDARWAPAHAGLARALAEDDPPGAAASARKAIEIDGALVQAHLFLVESALDGDRPGDARAAIERALAINPRSPEVNAWVAAMAYVDGRTPEYEAAMAKALGVNPTGGDPYRLVAAHAASNRLFAEAVALARQAIAIEPDNARAHADLGMHLLRTGDEREARRVLEIAFRADPYDIITYNLLQMLDTVDHFDSFKTGNVVVRLHPDEAPVLRLYAVPIVETAMATFGARYRLQPKGPIVVEVFPKHDDFAVRNLGLPGLLGALGACFGQVVTLDSPRARPPGSFNWQATLWHELAHVFTLQLSNYRVPRWLTEGISVYEEGRVRPEWARDSEMAFARAYAEGKAMKLADLNAGFTRPDMVELAYFQASLVVDLIVERFGEEALRTLLRAYAQGLQTDAALVNATKLSLDELQSAFDARTEERFAALGRALQVPEGVEMPQSADLATLQTFASRHRGSYPVQMAVGQALVAAGALDAALAIFERAAALVPAATGTDSPRARMADLAERGGNYARALRELTSLVADDHANIDAARKLVPLGRRLGNPDALALAYERIVTLDPFDASAHTALGRIGLDRRDVSLATREFRAALAAGPADIAPAHCDLAEALLLAGQRPEAKREVMAALEVAPTYERAQELLLRIVEGL